MRVRFIAKMPPRGYSGGRLLALTYAQALGVAGAEVEFLVDHVPEMFAEFAGQARFRIQPCDLRDPGRDSWFAPDVSVVVPCQGEVPFHGEATRTAIESGGRVALLNFESPNWFNSLSPIPRDERLWDGWRIVAGHADLILSLCAEGSRFAEDYYREAPKHCRFDYCHTAINSTAADAAIQTPRREKRVVCLTRVDPHKGFNNLGPLVTKELTGYEVQVYVGTGVIPAGMHLEWERKFAAAGMGFVVRGPIVGVRKFELLKASSLLFFPTRFEGFGIPPLEAAYCLLPCACSDLPVLREFGGRALCYGQPEDESSMTQAIVSALANEKALREEHERIRDIARLDRCGERLLRVLREVV